MFQHSPEIPRSLLELRRVFYILCETPEVPQHAFLVNTRFLAQLNPRPFPSYVPDDGLFPCFIWKGASVPVALKRRLVSWKLEESPGGLATI